MEALEGLQDLRRKVLNKEDVSAEEYATVIENLRVDRKAGASKPKKSGRLPPVEVDLLSLINKPVGGSS